MHANMSQSYESSRATLNSLRFTENLLSDHAKQLVAKNKAYQIFYKHYYIVSIIFNQSTGTE